IQRVAPYDSGVLITGPTGTGKELISRSIHRHSPRADGPFVPVDCAALTGELFASQLFGHVKGAFTGAHFSTLGSFGAADGGTIFLDEIGELEPMMQAKLLRVLQEKTVVPLGSYEGQPVDVRIIAATNRDLQEEVYAGRFREDLFYRLNVVSLKTLPLADRREDIEALARHILHKLAIDAGLPLKQLAPSAMNLLRAYDWPGNVRELSNQLERAVVFCEEEFLRAESMPQLVEAVIGAARADEATHPDWRSEDVPSIERPRAHSSAETAPATEESWPTIAELEIKHILLTLQRTFYNQSAAARLLGISRQSLIRKIKAHGLDLSRSHQGRPASP
ncbi:MAG: sigma-54-dependent Fis family transcriptional regulator, partial [Planctomycetes bacterium]|nr:sigma-54-dependent Fis family transcriptional regulator [Planctomycetota bacterium]